MGGVILRLANSHFRHVSAGLITPPITSQYDLGLDLLIAVDEVNARAVFNALLEFGAPLEGLNPEDFAAEGYVYQMGRPPLRVDVLKSEELG